jgi:3-dehydroquinate synthetase
MRIESRMANSSAESRVAALLDRVTGPAWWQRELERAGELWSAMLGDKKRLGGRVRIAVPDRLGEGRLFDVRREDLDRAVSAMNGASIRVE